MSTELHTLVISDLAERKSWEERQRLFYEMRHHGLRRRNKPFPGAADLHYPLADGQVDKLKPFYFAQIWGSEKLATFRAKKAQNADATQAAAAWFHYQLVQHTNYFREGLAAIDNMLMSGNTPVKVIWNAHKKALEFDAIDPVFFVVPPGTTDLQEADRVTHIMQMTESAYKRRTDYAQDANLIKRIKGRPNEETTKTEQKYTREGLTHGQSDDEIVLFETWERDAEGWKVHTYSPMAPSTPVKPPFRCTYQLDGKPFLPFIDLPMEIKDKGYYASRGIPERVAAFESYINRTWNEKSDSMAYVNKPLFTHEGETINLNNVRLIPGAVVGKNLKAVQMPQPAISFDVEMQNTRAAAEQLTAMPDFGMQKPNSGKDPRTATEINAVGNLMGMSTDLRARIFRDRLSMLYRIAWALLREFKKEDLSYFMADELKTAPAEALHDGYLIEPDGSPDSWNKPARMQRAVARYQMFKGHPNIAQGPLARSVLQEDDASLVKELYIDPQTTTADQQEDQAMELACLEKGFPARVMPADDDALHIDIVLGRLQMMLTLDEPITAVAWERMNQHMLAHMQQMQARDPKRSKEYRVKVQKMQQAMAQIHPPVEQFPAPQGAGQPAAVTGGVA